MTIISFEDLLLHANNEKLKIYEIAQKEEALLSEVNVDDIRIKTLATLDAMKNAIKKGLLSTEKSISKWCGDDAVKMVNRYNYYFICIFYDFNYYSWFTFIKRSCFV